MVAETTIAAYSSLISEMVFAKLQIFLDIIHVSKHDVTRVYNNVRVMCINFIKLMLKYLLD